MDIGEQQRVIIVEPEPLSTPLEEPQPAEPRSAPAPAPGPQREPVPAGR